MRKDVLCLLLAIIMLFSSRSLYAQSQEEQFPEFEFDVRDGLWRTWADEVARSKLKLFERE